MMKLMNSSVAVRVQPRHQVISDQKHSDIRDSNVYVCVCVNFMPGFHCEVVRITDGMYRFWANGGVTAEDNTGRLAILGVVSLAPLV